MLQCPRDDSVNEYRFSLLNMHKVVGCQESCAAAMPGEDMNLTTLSYRMRMAAFSEYPSLKGESCYHYFIFHFETKFIGTMMGLVHSCPQLPDAAMNWWQRARLYFRTLTFCFPLQVNRFKMHRLEMKAP